MNLTHEERKKALDVATSRDIVSVAQQLGMGLIKMGRTYVWDQHDSLVITPSKNMFYWNSRQTGGSTIQLVQQVKECGYKEAVAFLNDTEVGEFKEVVEKRKPFKYFMKEHEDMSESIQYLINQRQLSKETVDFFVSHDVLAQGTYSVKEKDHEENTLIFKHKNHTGKVEGISFQGLKKYEDIHIKRGTLKQTLGDGFYGLNVPIGNPPKQGEVSKEKPLNVIAFESPIDLMSYYEMNKESLNDCYLLSMNGLRKGTISTFVANILGSKVSEDVKPSLLDNMNELTSEKTDIISITLAIDNDNAGKEFVDKFDIDFVEVKAEYPQILENKNKSDWNEILIHQKKSSSELKVNNSEEKKEIKKAMKESVGLDAEFKRNNKNYLEIEFNETNISEGIQNLQGKVVTNELISTLKHYEMIAANSGTGYYKTFINEIVDNEIVNNFRFDLGDGVASNSNVYEYLEENAASLTPVKNETVIPSEPKKITEEIIQFEPVNISYMVNFNESLEEVLNEVNQNGEGTKEYLTKEEVASILDEHLNKVESILNNFSNSHDIMDKPTNKDNKLIQEGLFKTLGEVMKQYKNQLLTTARQKRNIALYNVSDNLDNIRLYVKNSFNQRILNINDKIKTFVRKLDVKFAIENKIIKEHPNDKLDEVALSPEQEMESIKAELDKIVNRNQSLSKEIGETISKNPVADVRDLQQELKENNIQIVNLNKELKSEKFKDLAEEEKTEVSYSEELEIQRENLLKEREELVKHPEFLNVKEPTEGVQTPLERFKEVEKELLENDLKRKEINSKKEEQKPENSFEEKVIKTATASVILDKVINSDLSNTLLGNENMKDISINNNAPINLKDSETFANVYYGLTNDFYSEVKFVEPNESKYLGYDFQNRSLTIESGKHPENTVYTLINEAAKHQVTNRPNSSQLPNARFDFEVEAITYVVATKVGLDVTKYQFNQLNKVDSSKLNDSNFLESLSNINHDAKNIIEKVDSKFVKKSNKFEERVAKGKVKNEEISLNVAKQQTTKKEQNVTKGR